MDESVPKIREKPSLGCIFRTFGICFTTLYALIWTGRDDLVHVQDCAVGLFQSGWFGKKKFLLQPSGAPNRGRTAQLQRKNDCCCYDIRMTVL